MADRLRFDRHQKMLVAVNKTGLVLKDYQRLGDTQREIGRRIVDFSRNPDGPAFIIYNFSIWGRVAALVSEGMGGEERSQEQRCSEYCIELSNQPCFHSCLLSIAFLSRHSLCRQMQRKNHRFRSFDSSQNQSYHPEFSVTNR